MTTQPPAFDLRSWLGGQVAEYLAAAGCEPDAAAESALAYADALCRLLSARPSQARQDANEPIIDLSSLEGY